MDNKSLAGRSSGNQTLYCIRPMLEVDIPQAKRIEMESFPEMWPPSPMRSELSNSLARYLVACQIPEFSKTSTDNSLLVMELLFVKTVSSEYPTVPVPTVTSSKNLAKILLQLVLVISINFPLQIQDSLTVWE